MVETTENGTGMATIVRNRPAREVRVRRASLGGTCQSGFAYCHGTTGPTGTDLTSSVGRRAECDLENVGLGEDKSRGHDTLTYMRPRMDIFKVIFVSDNE